jgi:small subunit ribosomal protein S16
MLAIRLQRIGRKKHPVYRVVVSEKTKDMYGNHLEILGQYDPHSKESVLKDERIKHWISVGAQASESVSNLLIKEGLLEGKKKKSVSISKKRAAKKEDTEAEKKEKEAPAEETKTEETPAAPVEEVKTEVKEEVKTEETK